jgi:hypothetical protein
MFTYQIRGRVFRHKKGSTLVFPNDVTIRLVLEPLQLFGMSKEGGRTTTLDDSDGGIIFNAYTGSHYSEMSKSLDPLDVTIESPGDKVILKGNILIYYKKCETLNELHEIISTFYFILPILFNIKYADPPHIVEINGTIGDIEYCWELDNWKMDFQVTNSEEQEKKFIELWDEINLVGINENHRLATALYYYYVANRLNRSAVSPGEFMAEAILNCAKILEVLFPPKGAIKTIDAARIGLSLIGYSKDEIEKKFVPVMILRNQVDSAHVFLSIFTIEELTTIHKYTERLESYFRELLNRVIAQIRDNKFKLESYELSPADTDLKKFVSMLAKSMSENK